MDKKALKKAVIDIVLMILIGCVVIGATIVYNRNYKKKSKGKVLNNGAVSVASINIWFCDDSLKPYIRNIKKSFEKDYQVKINSKYVDKDTLFESINEANKNNRKAAPDMYLFPSEKLESAYLGGMSKDVKLSDEDMSKLSETGIVAATYDGKMRAYPIMFEEPVFVYNKDLSSTPMKTFDEILAYAKEFDNTKFPNVTDILKWDVKELQYNYAFAGEYLNFGGKYGDNAEEFDVNNLNVKAALTYYNSLNNYFATDINTVNYDSIVNDFNDGKIVYTMINSKDLKKLDKVNYEVTKIPDMTDILKTRTLSFTTLLAVNPYGKTVRDDNNKEYVDKLISYMLFDKTDIVEKKSDYIPCVKSNTDNTKKAIYEQYEASIGLPKFEYASGFYVSLEIAMGKVWEGKNIDETVAEFENSLK